MSWYTKVFFFYFDLDQDSMKSMLINIFFSIFFLSRGFIAGTNNPFFIEKCSWDLMLDIKARRIKVSNHKNNLGNPNGNQISSWVALRSAINNEENSKFGLTETTLRKIFQVSRLKLFQ
jgi:hypothetical protein